MKMTLVARLLLVVALVGCEDATRASAPEGPVQTPILRASAQEIAAVGPALEDALERLVPALPEPDAAALGEALESLGAALDARDAVAAARALAAARGMAEPSRDAESAGAGAAADLAAIGLALGVVEQLFEPASLRDQREALELEHRSAERRFTK